MKSNVLKTNIETTNSLWLKDNIKEEVNSIYKQNYSNGVIISKLRDTEVSLMIDDQKYNIDHDIIWSTFYSLLPYNKLIILGTTRQIKDSLRISLMSNNKNIMFMMCTLKHGH